MTVPKHPVSHHWIKQTLVPFLLYAFASTLPYPADISSQIEQAICFCLQKPDHPSDGDDLIFERIFMAIMHRHRNLAPDLDMVVNHLEPLAKYLIRRAQLKGPFELLERTDVGSAAWVLYERQRLETLTLNRKDTRENLRPPVRPPPAPATLPPNERDIDPRLVHAQPGHFTDASTATQLTADEDSYYRRHNRELIHFRLRSQQPHMYNPAVPPHASMSTPRYSLPGRGSGNVSFAYGSPYQHPQSPTSIYAEQKAQQYGVSLQQTNPPLSRHHDTHMSPFHAASPTTFPHTHPARYPQTHHVEFRIQPSGQHIHSPQSTTPPQPHPPSFTPPTLPDSSPAVSAHERDALAQGIMQRQQRIARGSSPLVAGGATRDAGAGSVVGGPGVLLEGRLERTGGCGMGGGGAGVQVGGRSLVGGEGSGVGYGSGNVYGYGYGYGYANGDGNGDWEGL